MVGLFGKAVARRRGPLALGVGLLVLVACQRGDSPTNLQLAEKAAGTATQPGYIDAGAAADLARAVDGAAPGSTIPGHWIVVFRDDVGDATGLARRLAADHGAAPTYVYSRALKGFAAWLPPAAVDALQRNPHVERIEADRVATASGTQSGATWGLDRVDQHTLPLDASYTYDNSGSGVHAYIIDTGIRTTHTQFGGRASFDVDFIGDGNAMSYNGDCHGHGTHVAGTVGGATWGIAKDVQLHAVRVLDCNGSGPYSGLIAALDWVATHHVDPAVANMSLGGPVSSSVNTAVANAVAAGVVFAVAAGNSSALACNYSPASAAAALTVAASTSADARASFSNYGTCVDLFAPGQSITSSTHDSDTSTGTWSGTSMATPHVAGVAALVRAAYPGLSASEAMDWIVANTTPNVITDAGSGSPNLLLYSRLGASPTPPTAPTALAAAAAGTSRIDLGWTDNSTNESGFEIERRAPGGTFARIATAGAGATSYANTSLQPATTYEYRVRAVNGAGASDYSNTASATTAPTILVHVADVTASRKSIKGGVQGTAVVVVHDAGAQPVAGALVTGDWLVNGAVKKAGTTGTTGTNGTCSIASGNLKGIRSGDTVQFCVRSVSGTGFTYDPAANVVTCDVAP